jgi:putative tryptophan/tyrosine transport system substrate-binding protein
MPMASVIDFLLLLLNLSSATLMLLLRVLRLRLEAAKDATKAIPIIFASIGDPVRSGLVESLARPGGNITGLTIFSPELGGKRLELLKEAFPKSHEWRLFGAP